MNCPGCGAHTKVLETRRSGGGSPRRRRSCPECGRRFTTVEQIEPAPLFVSKSDGRRQRFDRTKLRAALLRAAHKRPVRAEDIESLVDGIAFAVEDAGGEVPSSRIGELCLDGLGKLDRGALLQFLAVYDADRLAALPGNSARGSELSGSASEKARKHRFSTRGSVRREEDDARLPAEND